MPTFNELNELTIKHPEYSGIVNLCRHQFAKRDENWVSEIAPLLGVLSIASEFNCVNRARQVELVRDWAASLKRVADQSEVLEAGLNLLRAAKAIHPHISFHGVKELLSIISVSSGLPATIQNVANMLLNSESPPERLRAFLGNWNELKAALDKLEHRERQEVLSAFFSAEAAERRLSLEELAKCLYLPEEASVLLRLCHGQTAKIQAKEPYIAAVMNAAQHAMSATGVLIKWCHENHQESRAILDRVSRVASNQADCISVLSLICEAACLKVVGIEALDDVLHAMEGGWPLPSVRQALKMYEAERIRIPEISPQVGVVNPRFLNLAGGHHPRVLRILAAADEGLLKVFSKDSTLYSSGVESVCRGFAHFLSLRSPGENYSMILREIVQHEYFSLMHAKEKNKRFSKALFMTDELVSLGVPETRAVKFASLALVVSKPTNFSWSPIWRDLKAAACREWDVTNWEELREKISHWTASKSEHGCFQNILWTLDLISNEFMATGSLEKDRSHLRGNGKFQAEALRETLEACQSIATVGGFFSLYRLNAALSRQDRKTKGGALIYDGMKDFALSGCDFQDWRVVERKFRDFAKLEAEAPKKGVTYAAFCFAAEESIIQGRLSDVDKMNYRSTKIRKNDFYDTLLNVPASSFTEFLKRIEDMRRYPDNILHRDGLAEYVHNGGRYSSGVRNAISNYGHDGLPFSRRDERQSAMMTEIYATYKRSFELHQGFGAMTIEAKRPLDGTPSLLQQFAHDCFLSAGVINTPEIDLMPGPGIVYGGLKVGKLFVPSPDYPSEPYADYKIALPWLAKELDDLESSRFLYFRGLIGAVGTPESDRYYLDGHHYSLLVYNDHFRNPRGWSSFLVPTELISEELKGRVFPLKEYNGQINATYDSSAHGKLTILKLEAMARERKLPILNLGWVSNLGGLANAYPSRSDPYFRWEETTHGTSDRAGHVHKYYLVWRGGPRVEEHLQPLRVAHRLVYELASSYFKLHDAFRLARSLWHKGWDSPEESVEFVEAEMEVQFDEEVEQHGKDINARMLRQAYAFHRNHNYGVNNSKQFPNLVVANTFDYSSIPQSPITLSTYDMSLTLPSGKVIQFPQEADGSGTEEKDLWSDFVMPYIMETKNDPRFYYPAELE